MKTKSKECSCIEKFATNLIETLKITTSNLKHTENTKSYFQQYIFQKINLFQKQDAREQNIICMVILLVRKSLFWYFSYKEKANCHTLSIHYVASFCRYNPFTILYVFIFIHSFICMLISKHIIVMCCHVLVLYI